MKISRTQLLGILLAAVSLAVMVLLVPASQALPAPAKNTLGVLIATIVLLVTQAFPIGITCLFSVPLLYFLGCVETVPGALSGFSNATLFFVLASFGISEAMTVCPISKRMLVVLMRRFGQTTSKLLFAIMLVTALLSSVISNVAAAAVFIPVIHQFLSVYDDAQARRRTARAYMIAMPVASMIGGMMTPAGSSINILVISMLEKHAGATIPFVDWMLMGIPMAAVLLPLSWLVFVKVYKPAPLPRQKLADFVESTVRQLPPKMTARDVYVIVVLGAMLSLWILSSWVPRLQIAAVALVGLFALCVPGKLNVLKWEDFARSVSLEAFILLGSMISIGGVISSSGLSAWLAAVLFPTAFTASMPLVIAFVAALVFVLLIPIPVAPALITMLAGPLVSFCMSIGVSPVLVMAALGLCASQCYLLPLDTVPFLTFSTGAYGMFDMPKSTALIQLVVIALASLWLPVVGMLCF
ncbi:MAG: SLC13 family permease [Eubacteriales bacterium]|nr:SLC13 family permease [Eubacteriales bacterium]